MSNHETIMVEIPRDVTMSLKIPESEIKGRLRTELAIRLYQKGILGFGKARELACLNKWQFQELLADENISVNYDIDEMDQDLAVQPGLP